MNTLGKIFRQYGCDKFDHGYDIVYENLFRHRSPPRRMLEVGIFRGASIASWLQFWSGTEIVAVDTFERIPAEQVWSIHHHRVHVIKADTTERPLLLQEPVDLIIDDGSHRPRDQGATFRHLWPLLREGGIYVIEDVFPAHRYHGPAAYPPWFRDRSKDYSFDAWLELVSAIPGTHVEYDLRVDYQPDSYLIVIHK